MNSFWNLNGGKISDGSGPIVPRVSSASMVSDASFTGFGAWCNDDWLFGSWSVDTPEKISVHDHVNPPPDLPMLNPNINTLKDNRAIFHIT